jgi:hypothetical protein
MKGKNRKADDAVSPVIGVLLMLVVTIIIAAVVSGFAGGLVGSQEKAPQASIVVTSSVGLPPNTYNTYELVFTHQSGEPINTKDVKIITWLTLPNGTVIKHTQSANSPAAFALRNSSAPNTIFYVRPPFIDDTMKYVRTNGEYLPQSAIDSGTESPAWFGKYAFTSGTQVRTYNANITAAFLGLVPDISIYPVVTTDTAYNDGANLLKACFTNQSQVEVKWLHVPSGKYILDKTITLKG